MFKQRASFDQSYDEGRFGRFGRHILGAQMALDLPFGIGPLQFTRFFPEDTHNSYLNAFMSGGWLSGVVLSRAGVHHRLRWAFATSSSACPGSAPISRSSAAFLGTVGESFIIDTDHWRHFWMMLGAMWGMFAATQRWMAGAAVPGAGCNAVLLLDGERQACMVDEPLDQLVLHCCARRPESGRYVRRIAQQADRAFGDHLRGRAVAGIAVACHAGPHLRPSGAIAT